MLGGRGSEALFIHHQFPSINDARLTPLPLIFDFVTEFTEAALTAGQPPHLAVPTLYKEPETLTIHPVTSPDTHFHFFSLQSTCRRAPPPLTRVLVPSRCLLSRHLV
jgi:hypothetical protein